MIANPDLPEVSPVPTLEPWQLVGLTAELDGGAMLIAGAMPHGGTFYLVPAQGPPFGLAEVSALYHPTRGCIWRRTP